MKKERQRLWEPMGLGVHTTLFPILSTPGSEFISLIPLSHSIHHLHDMTHCYPSTVSPHHTSSYNV